MSKKDRKPQPAPASSALAIPLEPERWETVVVWALMGAFTSAYLIACLVKYRYYLYNDFDMAMDAHAAWMLLHGSFHNSIIGVHYLGNHMRLLMAPIAPIYGLFPNCVTLLVIQTIGVAVGALPVFWLARREIHNGFVAVCFAALYLLYPALGYVCLYEFHPEALTTTTLLFTFYFLWTGRPGWMTVFALVSVLGKEDVAVAVLSMAAYALVIRRPKRWQYAAILAGIAIASLVLSFVVVMPPLNQGKVGLEKIYGQWGPTTGQALVAMAKDPARAIETFFSTPGFPGDSQFKLEYHVHILAPVMFLSLLSPLTLALALPAEAQHLLSQRITEHSIVYHYTTHVTPFVILAAILGLRNLARWLTRGSLIRIASAMRTKALARRACVLLAGAAVGVSLVCNSLFGPLIGVGVFQSFPISEQTWPTTYDRAMAPYMDRMVARIPAGVPVAADFRFLPRLVNRREIHSLHHIFMGNYTLSAEPYPVPGNIEAVAVDTADRRLASFERPDSGRRMQEFLAKNRLVPTDAAGSTVLWLRDAKDPVTIFETLPTESRPKNPRRIDYNGQISFLGSDEVPAEAVAGGRLPLRTWWRDFRKIDRYYLAQFLMFSDDGRPALEALRPLGYGVWPAHEWLPGNAVRETFYLVVPRDVRPGTYEVCLRLCEGGPGGLALSAPSDEDIRRRNGLVLLGRVTVTPPR